MSVISLLATDKADMIERGASVLHSGCQGASGPLKRQKGTLLIGEYFVPWTKQLARDKKETNFFGDPLSA
jgi:hypothetical protein